MERNAAAMALRLAPAARAANARVAECVQTLVPMWEKPNMLVHGS